MSRTGIDAFHSINSNSSAPAARRRTDNQADVDDGDDDAIEEEDVPQVSNSLQQHA